MFQKLRSYLGKCDKFPTLRINVALILSSVKLHEFCFNKYFYTEGPVIGNVEGDLGDLDLQAVEVDQDQGPKLQEAEEIGQGLIALNKDFIILLKPIFIFLQGPEEIIYFLINVLKVQCLINDYHGSYL